MDVIVHKLSYNRRKGRIYGKLKLLINEIVLSES